MARRKAPRVVWLPTTNAFSVDAATQNTSTISTAQHALFGINPGERITSVHSVVIDGEGLDPLAAGTTLADLTASSYRLRRIVGTIHCGILNEAADSPPQVMLSAGFMVLRVEPITGQPLSAATPNLYDVDDIEQGMDPWIWRRSWMIINQSSTSPNAVFGGGDNGLGNNFQSGGNTNGPHLDQKTARIVGPEERLFLILNSTVLVASTEQNAANIRFWWNLRVLASMRQGIGNRRNASR